MRFISLAFIMHFVVTAPSMGFWSCCCDNDILLFGLPFDVVLLLFWDVTLIVWTWFWAGCCSCLGIIFGWSRQQAWGCFVDVCTVVSLYWVIFLVDFEVFWCCYDWYTCSYYAYFWVNILANLSLFYSISSFAWVHCLSLFSLSFIFI